ncbi:MAG: transcriptional repressor [Deltaproteobacteria bacterium]|nr:transcriptional repressor [Deltaproteobacteria bacterium]
MRMRLKEAGLRATGARVAVLRCLLQAERPLSHAEVWERIGKEGFDRATVYRNLMDLTEAGLLVRTDLGDHLWRFEVRKKEHQSQKPKDGFHPHFICTECGAVECLPVEAVQLNPVEGAPQAIYTGQIEIQLRGTCNACNSP